MQSLRAPFLVALLSVMTACGSSVHSNLTINGRPYGPSQCTTQTSYYNGVDIVDSTGTTLRLVITGDGVNQALLFPSGTSNEIVFPPCVQMHMGRDHPLFGEGTDELEGTATLDCATTDGAWSIKGEVNFDDCDS